VSNSVEEVGIKLTLKEQREVAAGLKETEQGLDQVGDAGEKAGRKASRGMRVMRAGLGGVSRGLGVVANFTKRGVLGTVATGIGLVGTALYKGFNRLQSIEDATASLSGLGNSAKTVRSIMDNALASVRGTAFGMGEAATTAAGAVAAGVKPGKDLERTLKLVADAATIGKSSMGEMGSIFNKVATSGKVQGDVLNQLGDRGIPIVQLLAKEMGVTTAEVAEMSRKGTIDFNTFRNAMEAGMGGAALKSGDTTRGALANVGAAMSRLGATALQRFYPLFRRVFKQTTIVIDGLTERLGPLMAGFNRTLGPAMGKRIAGSGERILGWIDRQSAAVGRLYRAYKKAGGIKGMIQDLVPKTRASDATNLSSVGASIGQIGDAVDTVDWGQVKANFGQGASDTFSVFATVVGFLADNVDTLAKYLPALVAGWAAYRVAQAAANVASVFAIPLQVVMLGSQIAHTLALRANTSATVTNTAAETASTTVKKRSVAVTLLQSGATKGLAVAQRVLNVVMRANPIGLLITGLVLAAGAVYALYRKSSTFRGMVDGLWNNVLKPFGTWLKGVLIKAIVVVGKTFLGLGRFGVMAFRLLLTAAFKAFDGILTAAEKGLGWVPGLGDKIKGARAAFDQFGDATIAKLKRVEDRMRSASDSLDNLAKNRSATVDITTRYTTIGGPDGPGTTRGRGDDFLGGGATGGGQPGGKTPAPRVQLPPTPEASRHRPRTFDPSTMPTSKFDVYLDGKKVTTRVVRHVAAAGARS
jgi:tape measure domain-containing protein